MSDQETRSHSCLMNGFRKNQKSFWIFKYIRVLKNTKPRFKEEEMNIIKLNNNQIDKEKWDEKIVNSTYPTVYALSWYLDVVSPDWKALVTDGYEYIFPLTVKQKLKTIKYLGIPNFCQQLGLFSKSKIEEKVLVDFLSNIPKAYVRKDIHLNHSNPQIKGTQQKNNFVLSSTTMTAFNANYSTQTKRNLKKANANQLAIVQGVEAKELINMFRESKGKLIEKLDYSLLGRLCEICSSKSILHTVGVYCENELVSGAIFFEFNKRWYMVLLASSQIGKELLASTFLINAVLEKIGHTGLTLDFEGSSIPSLARFYKGFGGINEAYQLYSKRII